MCLQRAARQVGSVRISSVVCWVLLHKQGKSAIYNVPQKGPNPTLMTPAAN
jgi:hypothetical protein